MPSDLDRRAFLGVSACAAATSLMGQAPPPAIGPPSPPRLPTIAPPLMAPRPARSAWINFEYQVSWPSVAVLQQAVTALVGRGIGDLTLLISSTGGDIDAALSTYNFLTSAGLELTTYNVGDVYSAAVLLFLAGTRRVSEPSGQFIVHPPTLTGVPGSIAASQLELEMHALGRETKRMADIIVGRTRIPRERVEAMLRTTTFIDPAEAVSDGLATEVAHLTRAPQTALISLSPPAMPAVPAATAVSPR